MTQGDIINLITDSVASSGSVNYQPAAQNEWIIFAVGSEQFTADAAPNAVPHCRVNLTDGTEVATFLISTGQRMWTGYKIGVTNSIYIQVQNNNASTADISISGVQTK